MLKRYLINRDVRAIQRYTMFICLNNEDEFMFK